LLDVPIFSIWRFLKRLLYGLLPGDSFAQTKRRPVVTRWQTLAIALVAAGMTAAFCNAQPAPGLTAPAQAPAQNLDLRYPVTPQAGEWLILVQTFKGEQAQVLAEQMAEMMTKEHKLPAYLYVKGRKERAEEEERVQKMRQQYDEMVMQLRSQNPENRVSPFRAARFAKIEEEFAVLISDAKGFKDMDCARDFLPKLRKLPAPPKEFSCWIELGDLDPTGKKMSPKGNGYLNPFMTAMVVRNPTIPHEKQEADPGIADELLKKLNANETLSVLRCSKPYTLVVKVYQGPAFLKPPEAPSLIHRVGETLGIVEKNPESLDVQALKARELADFLRKMKPSFESYVMHEQRCSIVTVGQFDSLDDPNLLACQRSLAGFQLKNGQNGQVIEQLTTQPVPMKIPK
jgi:hypothetical protein